MTEFEKVLFFILLLHAVAIFKQMLRIDRAKERIERLEQATKQKPPEKIQERGYFTLSRNEERVLSSLLDGEKLDYLMAGPGLKEIYDRLISLHLVVIEYEPLLVSVVHRLKLTDDGEKTVKAARYRVHVENATVLEQEKTHHD